MEPKPRKPYETDVTDGQWEAVKDLIPPSHPGGRPREVDPREVLNAILYLVRTNCPWRMLPHDFPPKSTVYDYYCQWRDEGVLQAIMDRLRDLVREQEAPSNELDPSAAVIDSQTVESSEHSGERGYDGGKKIKGRKRHIVVDTLGMVLAVVVTPASIDDAKAAELVMEQLKVDHQSRLEVIWGDNTYHNHTLYLWIDDQRDIDWRLEIVRRESEARGFVPIRKRWIVERTFSWLGRWRRLSRDVERLTCSSEAMVKLAAIGQMLRRLDPPIQPPFKYRLAS